MVIELQLNSLLSLGWLLVRLVGRQIIFLLNVFTNLVKP